MVQPGAGVGLQLRSLRPQAHPPVLHPAHVPGQGCLRGGEERSHHVHKHPRFKFLDVLNYLAPGITYDKWVKTYGATLTKSWLPYEWFDSPDKLDFPGLPPYLAWYSRLKGEYVLTLKEYEACHRVFRKRGMRTFSDWLEYYNNLDVAPFLEALQKMKEFYTGLGVDIFKDAVSLPGVSQQYILRKTLQPRRGATSRRSFTPPTLRRTRC